MRFVRRSGVGSIIGSAFLILILLTGFTFISVQYNGIRDYARAVQDIQNLSEIRNMEELIFVDVATTASDKLNVTLRNGGASEIHLIYLVMYNESSITPDNYEMDIKLKSGEILTDLPSDSVIVLNGEKWEIQFITELGNVFSYSYPEDGQSGGSGEGGNDNAVITIRGVGSYYNATSWNLLGGTTAASGDISDLETDDSNYAVFNAYPTGNAMDIIDYVDNDSSDVDGSADKGSHGSFPAQQAGPDSTYDTLTEELISTPTPPTYETFAEASSSGNVVQIQVNKPSGTVEGDLLFAVFSKDDRAGVLSSPSGWTDLGEGSTGGSRILFTYKIATASEPATYTFTSTDSDQMCVSVARFSGVDPSDPIDVYSSLNTGNDAAPTCPTVDTGASETTILRAMGADDDDYSTPGNYPGGHVGIFTSQSTGSNGEAHCALAYTTQSSPGATGAASYSITAAEQWGTMTVVLKPPSESRYELDLEVQWTGVDYSQTGEELAIYAGSIVPSNPYSLDATGGYMVVGDGTPDWGSTSGTLSFWMKFDAVGGRPWGQDENMEMRISGSNLILDWGGTQDLLSSTSFIADKWYFIAVTWNENTDELTLIVGDESSPPSTDTYVNAWTNQVSTLGVLENNFIASKGGVDPLDGHGDDLRYYDVDRLLTDIQADYDSEITGFESNLRSYFKLNGNYNDNGPDNNDGSGSGSTSFAGDVPFGGGSEPLNIDVWYGGAWQSLISGLSNGWNNVSVAGYLDSSTFTIRYRGGSESGDSSQDSWDMDAALLHLSSASNQYTVEVEFLGSSNGESWSELFWGVDSSWNTSDVMVSVQLYDYQAGAYPTGGDGFEGYTSVSSPGVDEVVNETVTVNPTYFGGVSGDWRVKVSGVKSIDSSFNLNMDWVTFKPTSPTTGNIIDYDTWQEYLIRVRTSDGQPVPYAQVCAWTDGSSVSMRDANSKASISNPGWINLDINGEYNIELKSATWTQETFNLNVVVDSVLGHKSVTQNAP